MRVGGEREEREVVVMVVKMGGRSCLLRVVVGGIVS